MATEDSGPNTALDDFSEEELAVAERVISQLREQGDLDDDGLLARMAREPTTRRQALGVLAGGALLGGGATSQLVGSASAGSAQSGTVGSSSNPVDAYAEDIFPPGGAGSGNTTVINAADPSDLFALHRNADVVLTALGSPTTTTRALDKDGIVDEDTDAGTVLSSVYTNLNDGDFVAGKGRIVFLPGQYDFSSTPEVTRQGVVHQGMGRNVVTLRANASLTALFDVASSRGSRLVNGPEWHNLTANGASSTADHFVSIDSSRDGVVKSVETDGFAQHAFEAESTVGQNIDGWHFEHIRDTGSEGVLKALDGSAGQFADSVITNVRTNGLDGWGLDLQDTERVRVRDFEAGNNSSGFDGAVRLLTTGSGSQNNVIVDTYAENNIGTPTATAVHVDAQTGVSNFTESNEIVRPRANPPGDVDHAVVEATDAGDTRDTRIIRPQKLAQSTLITVGANAVETEVQVDFEGDAYALVSDSGTRTTVNGVGRNAGDPSSTGDWNGKGYEGVTVWDSSNSTLYEYVAGGWR